MSRLFIASRRGAVASSFILVVIHVYYAFVKAVAYLFY